MVKAAFFDIDGTLTIMGTQTIPDSTLQALKQLKEKGIKVFIATGRPVINTGFILEKFDFDGYLALNGQYCVIDGELVRNCWIPKETFPVLLPYLEEKQVATMIAELDYVYMNHSNAAMDEYCKGHMRPLDDPARTATHNTYQLMTYIPEQDEDDFFRHCPGCKAARWNPLFTDVIPVDGGKNKGIDEMCRHIGCTADDVIAFGDGGNDIDMLRHVRLGIAMGNADDKVKAAADYITDDVAQDGIMKALKHLGIL
jgi:hypothetical protein